MRTSISKKLLAGALSVMMVLSLVAPTGAQAASKYSVTGYKTVKAGKTYTYKIKGVKKSQYVKVQRNVSGETVKYNKKALTAKKQVKGTGKNLTLKVKFSEKNKNYTGKFTVRIYNAKSNKLVKKIVKSVNVKTQVEEKKAVESVTLSSTTPKVGDTLTATATPADAEIASYVWYADGVAIEGATTATYVVASTDLTKKISVAVTDSLGNTVTSEQTAAVVEADKKELELTAKQTGASTIELVSNIKLVNDDAITVTRGTTEQKVTKAFSEDGKTVTLTLATAIAAADYVIKVVPKDTAVKEATVTVKGEKSVLKEIKFESDKLVLLKNDGTLASVVVNGYDQFGAKVALTSSNMTFYGAGAKANKYTTDTGVLIMEPSGAFPFTVGNAIAVTAVYTNGTTVVQQQASLTVSAAAYVKTLEFGEIATTNADLKDKKVTLTNFADNSYYYPIKATNQYDQALTAEDLDTMKSEKVNTLLVSPSNTGYAYIDSFDTLKDGTVIAKVKKGSAQLVPTTVPLSIISVGGGSFTTNLVIEDDPYIATIDATIPETYGEAKVEVSVDAKDQNGSAYDYYKTITLANNNKTVKFGDTNHLTNQGSSLEASEGKFSLVKDAKAKTVKIYYQYKEDPAKEATDSVVVKSATPTVSTIKVTINPAGKVTKVQGLASGVATTLNAKTSALKLGNEYTSNIVFLDNYGAAMSKPTVAFSSVAPTDALVIGFYYIVKLDGVIDDDGEIAWNAPAEAKSHTVTVELYQVYATDNGKAVKKINGVDTTLKFEATSDSYNIYLAGGSKMYVADGSGDDDEVVVEYYLDGVEASVPGTLTYSDDLGLVNKTNGTVSAAAARNLPDNTTGTDNIYVYVDGAMVGSTTVEYSNVVPTAAKVSWVKNVGTKYVAAADAETVAAASYTFDGSAFTIDGCTLKVVDQYGQLFTDDVWFKLNGQWLENGNDTINLLNKGKANTLYVVCGEVEKTVRFTNNDSSDIAADTAVTAAATAAERKAAVEALVNNDVAVTVGDTNLAGVVSASGKTEGNAVTAIAADILAKIQAKPSLSGVTASNLEITFKKGENTISASTDTELSTSGISIDFTVKVTYSGGTKTLTGTVTGVVDAD